MKNNVKKDKIECKKICNTTEGDEYCDRINTDPYGSWTGVPRNEEDMPIQDVDDL